MRLREWVAFFAESEEWFLRQPGCSLYISERGSGDAVVLLHGGPGGEHSQLLPLMALSSDFRVVAYDRRGCLRSPAPEDTIGFEADVSDLEALIGAVGGRAHLVAYSAGALLVGALMAKAPDVVRRVVLISPAPLKEAEDELHLEQAKARLAWERARPARALAQLGLPADPSGLSDRERSRWGMVRDAALFLHDPRRWRARIGASFYSPAVSELVGASTPVRYDYVPVLTDHEEQVTVIVGDSDLVDLGARLAQSYFHGSTVAVEVVPEAGHDVWIDQPDRFEAALRKGLGS